MSPFQLATLINVSLFLLQGFVSTTVFVHEVYLLLIPVVIFNLLVSTFVVEGLHTVRFETEPCPRWPNTVTYLASSRTIHGRGNITNLFVGFVFLRSRPQRYVWVGCGGDPVDEGQRDAVINGYSQNHNFTMLILHFLNDPHWVFKKQPFLMIHLDRKLNIPGGGSRSEGGS